MKFLLQFVFIVIVALVLQLFLPWWSLVFAGLAGGFFLKSRLNFLAGFLSIALLWGGYALLLDSVGAAPLAERVAGILTISKPLLFVATALIGGLVGGFAALTGSLLKADKRKSLYY